MAFGALLTVMQLVQFVGLTISILDLATALKESVAQEAVTPEDAAVVDVFLIFENTTALVLVALLAAFVGLIVRYAMMLIRGIKRAHPDAWRSIRGVARTQTILALLGVVVVEAIFADVTTMAGTESAGSLGLILGPAVWYLSTRPDVKAYFSVTTVERAGEPPTSPAHDVETPAFPG